MTTDSGGLNVNGVSDAQKTILPAFAFSELKLGRVIGKGGFSIVHEVKRIQLDDVYDTSEEETNVRKEFSAVVNHSTTTASASTASTPNHNNHDPRQQQQRFVMKMLRTDLPPEEHAKGVVDLAIEADFLRELVHPNIIRMRGTANCDPHSLKFFVLLDRLVVTLERKMNFWRREVSENMGIWIPFCGYWCAKTTVLHRLWMERLMVSRDIAMAVEYLHSQNVVYRDLKPDNVGFDARGDVKIFDFGLAKRLNASDRSSVNVDLYNLTGNTGSLRYMAPEVAKCEPYDQSVDAYSFGILFWQICALTTPYLGYSTKMHAERVVRGGHRPKPDSSWPHTWTNLMKDCWSTDLQKRPNFQHVVHVLDEEVTELLREEGVLPSNEIKAKKKKKNQTPDNRLDVDTRLSSVGDNEEQESNEATAAAAASAGAGNVRNHDKSIV